MKQERWIPVSKRLPREFEQVLVTVEYGKSREVLRTPCYILDGVWVVKLWPYKPIVIHGTVVAWRKLPKLPSPYKGNV